MSQSEPTDGAGENFAKLQRALNAAMSAGVIATASPLAIDEANPMFTFRCGTSGAMVTCHHCGWRATGRWPKDVYPEADRHTCGGRVQTAAARYTHALRRSHDEIRRMVG